ncbi:hypothetical protein L6452_23582 [Arctium lappa]|uniref:Uncharacterized protein n=1 Tax=Arctium lappa TaxID=4217 RepID=A0ACB9B1E5_ARCLA|nr:hypothetical protein L6452_23582 [Arctium lappa]
MMHLRLNEFCMLPFHASHYLLGLCCFAISSGLRFLLQCIVYDKMVCVPGTTGCGRGSTEMLHLSAGFMFVIDL